MYVVNFLGTIAHTGMTHCITAKLPDKPVKKVLIQLKGKNRIHVRQVELSSKSLNKADVFILDLGDRVLSK